MMQTRSLRFGSILVFCLTFFYWQSAIAEQWRELSPCIQISDSFPHAYVVKVNLKCDGVKLFTTPDTDTFQTTSNFAQETGSIVAINGDYFNDNKRPMGLAISDGIKWKNASDKKDRSFFACTANLSCVVDSSDNLSKVDPHWGFAIGGLQRYENGRFSCAQSAHSTGCTPKYVNGRHPRTALGVTANGDSLFLVVVEGRLHDFEGMTLEELSDLFRKLGVEDGLNLDGGGSSTMVVHGKRINHLPQNQANERPVGNHLGVGYSKTR